MFFSAHREKHEHSLITKTLKQNAAVHFLSAWPPSVCFKKEAVIIHYLITVYQSDWKEAWQHPFFCFVFFLFFEAVNNVQWCKEKAELHCALSYQTNAGLRHLKTEFSVAERILKLFKLRTEAKNEHLSSQRHRDPLKSSFWPESWLNIVTLQPDKLIKVFIEGILMLIGQCSLLHT